MATIEENTLGSFLPTVYISKIVLNDKLANVEFFIIDSIVGEELTSFLNDEILKDCLNIVVFQSTDESYTQQIINNDASFNKIILIDKNGEKREIPTDRNLLIDNLNLKIISFKDLQYSETDEEGNRLYFYSLDFPLPEKINDLSYVVYSQLNLDSLQKKFNISFSSDEILEIPKKTTIEDVIQDGEILTKSYNFLLENGQLWTGEVIEVNNQYKTLEQSPRNLQAVETPNYKVQDFRARKLVQKSTTSDQFEFAVANIANENIIMPNLPNNSTLSISSPSIFPSVTKIVNSDKSVSISVLINTEQLIKQNSLYPELLTPDMLNSSDIVSSLSLWRRQLKSYINGEAEVEESASPVLVTSDFKQYEVNINNTNKHFLITDNNVINVVDGLYQYGIELSFYDPTITELKNKLIVAKQVRKNILEYYSFCQAYVDPNTGNLQSIVSKIWDINTIEQEHVQKYINCIVSNNVDKNMLFQSLRAYVSPITGNLDGISLFVKLLDDLIHDITNMLDVVKISSDDLETNEDNLKKFNTKSLTNIFKYFKETVYNSSEDSKVQLNYLNIINGKVTSEIFSNRIYPNTQNNETIYLAPEFIKITNDKFNFDSFEDTYPGVKDDKYLLLKNKLLEIKSNKNLYANTDNLQFLKIDSGGDDYKLNSLYEASNSCIESFLFNDHSVVFEDLPTTNNPVVKYDKIIPLNKILSPQKILKISSDFTDVNILKNREIDLSSVEHDFKYRLLNRVEYLIYDNSTKTIKWEPLTINKIDEQKNIGNLNILCRLVAYDYSSVLSLKIDNINNYDYNNTFILSLEKFAFIRKDQPKSSETKTINNLSSNTKNINFLDVKVNTVQSAQIEITYNGSRREDFYCSFDDNTFNNPSLKLEKNMFGPIKKGEKMLLKVTFSPFNQQKFSTNLIIKGQRYDDVFKIPLIGNTLKEKPELPKTPTNKDIVVEFNPKPISQSIDKILPSTKISLPESTFNVPIPIIPPIIPPIAAPTVATNLQQTLNIPNNLTVPSINTATAIISFDKTIQPSSKLDTIQQPAVKTTATTVIPTTDTQQPAVKTTATTKFAHDSRTSVGASTTKRAGR